MLPCHPEDLCRIQRRPVPPWGFARARRQVRSSLWAQRKLLTATSGALGGLATRFPTIGRVIGSIQQRRYRDNMVVALAIAACICFTLYWLFG